jgi:MoaA/NifB/PqqE/SkfB family radical SAM enzyme
MHNNLPKDYKIEKGEVLEGSALLKKQDSNSSRVKYMIKNINDNKAFQEYFLNKYKDKSYAKKNFIDKFIKYRSSWNDLPKYLIDNKYDNKRMEKESITPLCLDIETASICDLACPFCFREYLATPDKIIDEKKCYDLIDQAVELGIPSIKFNWRGEPLLHPKLPDFINYAKKNGILETMINTNATNLNEKMANRLIDSGLDFLIYSFDGGTKETYEKMRPGRFGKNSFDKVYQNIINFSKIKASRGKKFPYTKIQMILTEDTHKEKDQFFDLFKNYVNDVSVSQYTERGGKLTDLDEESQSIYYHLLLQHNLPKGTPYMKDAFGNIKLSGGRKPCEQPFQRLLVTYEGRVAMCCYDWGASYPVGYTNAMAFNNDKDYEKVIDSVNKNKKGFELLKNIKISKSFNNPKKEVLNLKQIWYGNEIGKVRNFHISNKGEEVNICSNCSFKDVYAWL